jgi:hypothetical protein
MRKRRILSLLMTVLAAVGLTGYATLGYGAHSNGPVILKDVNGADIAPGSSTPYSPKKTCGVCHNYESDFTVATKDHGPGTTQYQVPYPQHGVTAGYHFQQGRNLDWSDSRRHFYHVPDFTSSGGMYGKY